MNKYPTKITPCPIVETTIDIVCTFTVPKEAVIGLIYNQLVNVYGGEDIHIEQLPICNIPEEIRRQDINLKNKPTHQISCLEGILFIGSSSLSFGILPPYESWIKAKTFISKVIETIKFSSIIKDVSRTSIKYLNFFENNIFEETNLNITLCGQQINYPSTVFRTEIPSNGKFVDILQITNGVHIKNPALKLNADGSLIDLCIVCDKVSIDILKDVIDDCHQEAKKLFFDLLNEKFLNSLNPEFNK